MEFVNFLKNPQQYHDLGARIPKVCPEYFFKKWRLQVDKFLKLLFLAAWHVAESVARFNYCNVSLLLFLGCNPDRSTWYRQDAPCEGSCRGIRSSVS